MNEYKFNLQLTSTKTISMGTYSFSSNNLQKISFDIKVDPIQADVGGEITIYNIDNNICDIFVISNNPNNYFPVELSVGYMNNYSKIFNGYCVQSEKEIKQGSTLININLKVQGFNYKKRYSFRFNTGTPYSVIKQTIANELGLQISSSISTDNNTLQEKLYLDTYTPIEDLKSVFPEQNIYVNNKTLYFTSKNTSNQYNYTKQYSLTNEIEMMTISGLNEYSIRTSLFPQIQPNDLISIQQENKNYKYCNGLYVVKTTRHTGTIGKYGAGITGNTECVLITKL